MGIPGIPGILDQFLDGAMYAAIVESAPARFSLMLQALRRNLDSGATCVLLTPMPPGVFLSRAESAGVDFDRELETNKLYLFSPEGDYAKNIFRLGAKRFLDEFEIFGVPKGSLFLFDQATDLFTLHDQTVAHQQAREYRDWMKPRGSTALFIFPVAENEKAERQYQSLQDYFTGEIRIIHNKASLELLVDFWYSPEGAVAAKFLPIAFDESGFLRVEQSEEVAAIEPAPQIARQANDQDQAFYYGPDFDSFVAAMPQRVQWSRAESLVNLVHLTVNAVAATIVIALDRNSELRPAAEVVHYLRLSLGAQVRIVIRECHFFLRTPTELLLMRLGANLVIHPQTAPHRLPLLWESLAGQVFSREVDQNFNQAFDSVAPSNFQGYLDLGAFCREALAVIDRLDHHATPPALVVARYPEGADIAETLCRVSVSRKGDLLSSSPNDCYLFLHSCPESHLAQAFSRIVGGQQQALFASVGFLSDADEIRRTLDGLAAGSADAPDYGIAMARAAARTSQKVTESDAAARAIAKPDAEPAVEPVSPGIVAAPSEPAEGEAAAPAVGSGVRAFYFGPGFESFAAKLPASIAWKMAESPVALAQFTRGRLDALVLVSVDSRSDLRQIAETVHGLRLSLGRDAKIVIREHDFSLRRPFELLLLKLGANLLIHRDLDDSQLAALWNSLDDLVYSGEPEADFERLFESVAPSQRQGYVDLPIFCEEVLAVMERADEAVIPPALIVGTYPRKTHPPEVLSRIKVWRKGDLLSSDREQCFLFLHSCPESSLALAFSRIVEDNPAELFSEIGYVSEKQKIRDILIRVSGSRKASIIPDYGKMLREMAGGGEPAASPGTGAAQVKGMFDRFGDVQQAAGGPGSRGKPAAGR